MTATEGRALRIGLVCPYSLTVPGGVQGQVMGLARVLRRQGHEARVIGPCDGPPPATFVTPLGKSLPTAANGSIAPVAPDLSAALRTIRALNDEEFDVLHLHEPLVPGPTMTATFLQAAPMVGTFHSAGRNTSYQVFNGIVRALADRLDLRVAVSKDALLLAETHLGGTYDLLFNGVDVDEYDTRPVTREQLRTIFFCGRHEERKGLDVFLESMAHLDRDVRCWVAGTGPDTDRLRKAHGHDPRIEWLGRLSDAEKVTRLQQATLFCAPSLHGESFGVVLLEAMAAGTPIVASGLDGYRNVATHGVDAFLVEPGDAARLAGALRQMLDDSATADSMAAAGRLRAKEFSMDRLAAEYVTRYRRVIEAADRGDQRGRGRDRGRAVRRALGRMIRP